MNILREVKAGERMAGLVDGYVNEEYVGFRDGNETIATIQTFKPYEKSYFIIKDVSIEIDEDFKTMDY